MSTATAERVTIDQAFQSAKAELDKPATPPAEEKTVEKPEPGDTKADSKESQTEQTDKAAGPSEETAETELLSLEERNKLDAAGKKAYKQIMKAFTTKTQALAEERKKIAERDERYSRYGDLIDSLEADPKDTLLRLAKAWDIPLTDASAKQDTKPGEASKSAVDTQVSQMESDLLTLLGSEQQPLAQGLASIFEKHMRAMAQTVAKTEVEPMKRQQDEITSQAAADQAANDMKVFGERHKDWKQYEPKIVELSRTIQPAAGAKLDPVEYLELLYTLATKDKSKAETTTEVVERLKKSVEAATETPDVGVQDRNVSLVAPKSATIAQAMEAAKKGIRWQARQ